MMMETNLVG